MAVAAGNIPDKVLFHINSKIRSIGELLDNLYGTPDQDTQRHFYSLNSHLKQTVQAGQVVFIAPTADLQCKRLEPALRDAAVYIDKHAKSLSVADIQRINQRYEFLSLLAAYSDRGYGLSTHPLTVHKLRVERLLQQIEFIYSRTCNKYGKLQSQEFHQLRRNLFRLLDQELSAIAGRRQMGLDIADSELTSSLGLSGKCLVRQLRSRASLIQSIAGFARCFTKLTDYGERLGRIGLVGNIALDGLHDHANIREACTTGRERECTNAKFDQIVRSAGAGYVSRETGRASGYAFINLAFGIEACGSSLLWCGIIAGGSVVVYQKEIL